MDPWTPLDYGIAFFAFGVLVGSAVTYGWIYYGEVKKRKARYQQAKWKLN